MTKKYLKFRTDGLYKHPWRLDIADLTQSQLQLLVDNIPHDDIHVNSTEIGFNCNSIKKATGLLAPYPGLWVHTSCVNEVLARLTTEKNQAMLCRENETIQPPPLSLFTDTYYLISFAQQEDQIFFQMVEYEGE